MSDTPRTDAFHNQTHLNPSSAYAAVLQLARQLELELTAAKHMAEVERQCTLTPQEELLRAAELLRRYASVVRECHSHELERFDYLPEIEEAAENVLAAARRDAVERLADPAVYVYPDTSKPDSADGQSG